MWRGIPASVVLHAGVIFGGMVVWPFVSPPRSTDFVIVPIELVAIAPTTNIAPSVRREPEEEPEPEEEEAPPPTEDVIEDPDAIPDEELVEEDNTPPPPPPEEEPEPEPDVIPEEAEPEEEEPEPEPEPEPEEEEPEPVRAEPEQNDPLDDILGEASNLFDRARNEPKRAPVVSRAPEPVVETPTEVRRGAGDRSGMTARVETILISQLKLCWDDVVDLPNPQRLQVTVRMQLNIDGTLRSGVEVVSPRRTIGDRPMQVAVERALRAVRKCAPYRLPEGSETYYDEWNDVTVNIGPAG